MKKSRLKTYVTALFIGCFIGTFSCTNSQKDAAKEEADVVATPVADDNASGEDSTEVREYSWDEEIPYDGDSSYVESSSEEPEEEGEAEAASAASNVKDVVEEATAASTSSAATPAAATEKVVESVKTEVAKKAPAATAAPKDLEGRLNAILAQKGRLKSRLDCMKYSKMRRDDLKSVTKLQSHFRGVFTKMVTWVSVDSENKVSKYLRKGEEKMADLEGLTTKWEKVYKYVDTKSIDILDRYKDKDFYKNCAAK